MILPVQTQRGQAVGSVFHIGAGFSPGNSEPLAIYLPAVQFLVRELIRNPNKHLWKSLIIHLHTSY